QHLDAFSLDCSCQCPYAETRSVFGAVVFIDDDDGKSKLHAQPPARCAAALLRAGLGIYRHDRGTTLRRLHRFQGTASAHSPRPRKSSPVAASCWKIPM